MGQVHPCRVAGCGISVEDEIRTLDQENGVLFALRHDPAARRTDDPAVSLQLLTNRGEDPRALFIEANYPLPPTGFQPQTLFDHDLLLHGNRPVTELAYSWLARDLHAVGWFSGIPSGLHYP
jgi:hypothetical protein